MLGSQNERFVDWLTKLGPSEGHSCDKDFSDSWARSRSLRQRPAQPAATTRTTPRAPAAGGPRAADGPGRFDRQRRLDQHGRGAPAAPRLGRLAELQQRDALRRQRCRNLEGDVLVPEAGGADGHDLAQLGLPVGAGERFPSDDGTFIARADGSYADNTTTSGSVTFPLAPACLSVSSVAVPCNRIASIFMAAGWDNGTCTVTDGMCGCALSVEKQRWAWSDRPVHGADGSYTTSGNTLTVENVTYSYCASGDTLTVTPQASALTGTVVLQRAGRVAVGGAGGSGGAGGGRAAAARAARAVAAGGAGGPAAVPRGASGTRPAISMRRQTTLALPPTARFVPSSLRTAARSIKSSAPRRHDPRYSGKSPGGVADSAQQDSFCMGTTCTILRVYDQSGHGNFLEAEIPGSTVGGLQGQTAANAAEESLTVGGNKVYSLYTRPRPGLLERWLANGHAGWRRASRHLHGDERHALQRWLLLQLR